MMGTMHGVLGDEDGQQQGKIRGQTISFSTYVQRPIVSVLQPLAYNSREMTRASLNCRVNLWELQRLVRG